MKTETSDQTRIEFGNIQEIDINSISISSSRRPVNNLDSLVESIQHVGLLNPITLTTDMRLIAGLHRLRACEKLGWKQIPAMVITMDELTAELAEIDENLIRNELTVLERSEQLLRRREIYAKLHPNTKHGRNQHTRGNEIISFPVDTANKTGVTARTIQQEIQIAQKLTPEVREAIRETELADNKTELMRLAKLTPQLQKEVAGRLQHKSSGVRLAVRAIQAQEIRQESPKMPIGKFMVIVADPPWRYENGGSTPYPDMSTEEICAVPVADKAMPDCILWLWTTNAHMCDAYSVLAAWGFEPKTILTWVKDRMGRGEWLRGKTEHCIMAVRGQPIVELTNQTTVLEAPVREHSRKPDEFYKLVEQLCPGSKLDLFARETRPGWEVFGDEPNKFS